MAPVAKPSVDPRPWSATLLLLGLALAANAWAGNGLWFWYTLIGLGVLLTWLGLARAGVIRPTSAAVWIVGVAAAMHYLGGSLSGLHQVGGVNGLYFVFPWWDNAVHTIGSVGLAVAAYASLRPRMADVPRVLVALAAMGTATVLGVLAELYEFAQFLVLGTIDQGFYTNTLLDLYYNLLGASLGAAAHARMEGRHTPSRVGAGPAPSVPPGNAF